MTQTRSKLPSLLDKDGADKIGQPGGGGTYREPSRGPGMFSDKWAVAKAVGSIAVLGLAVMLVISSIRGQGPDLAGLTSTTVVKSASTGKLYMRFPIPPRLGPPWKNPDTGAEDDLWPVEECWWADKTRTTVLSEPEYVIVRNQPGERAICPRCGLPVTPQNRRPTEEQIEAARAGRAGG